MGDFGWFSVGGDQGNVGWLDVLNNTITQAGKSFVSYQNQALISQQIRAGIPGQIGLNPNTGSSVSNLGLFNNGSLLSTGLASYLPIIVVVIVLLVAVRFATGR